MEWLLIATCLVAAFYCGHSRAAREKEKAPAAPNTLGPLGYSRGGPRERGVAALGLKLE